MASPAPFDPSRIDVVLCDLDGVVWLAHQAIAGSADAVDRLRSSGRRVLFVTNNSSAVVADHEAALAAVGIAAQGDVVSSAQAAASLIDPGSTVVVCGGAGVVEAVEGRGATAVAADDDPTHDPHAVVVGIDRELSYRRLDVASSAIRSGARFVATNSDTTYPTPDGLRPGAGSIVAAVAAAAGVEPEFAGKPEAPMAAVVRDRIGPSFDPDRTLMVGDRRSTDGAFAGRLGCRFALVRTGVTAPDHAPDDRDDVVADLDVADLAAVVDVVTRAAGEFPRSGDG